MVDALKESFASKESNWIKESMQAAANFEDGLYVQAVLEAIRKSNIVVRNSCGMKGRIMPMNFNIQNLAHVLWVIIIVLNIYVVVLLYRVAKQYRFERVEKLIITRKIRQKIDFRRKIWLKSFNNKEIIGISPAFSSYVSSCAAYSESKSSTTDEWCLKPIRRSNEQNLQLKNRRQQQQRQEQTQIQAMQRGQQQGRWQSQLEQRFMQRPPAISPSSSSSPCTSRSQVSLSSATLRLQGTSDSNNLHRSLLTDSYGRAMQEIPFCECDYAEAVRRACGGDGGLMF
uniref:Uncharacterized protein n=1 Tax=Glossina austeni TaxID=7395 RepID=A0A1A9V9H9_GLOAU